MFGAGIGPLAGGIFYDKFQSYRSFELIAAIVIGSGTMFLAALGP
ncbi:MAG TPA: hypothetical protein VN154_01870 [Rhizomicrobium sp.]|nr:hypothetical protein [Rhizomicrobium sp.]